jgi:hypothetical protein
VDLLDRLAGLLRALLGDGTGGGRRAGHGTDSPRGPGADRPSAGRPADPDLAAAWDELNDYLGDGSVRGGGGRDGSGRDGGSRDDRGGGTAAGAPPGSLRQDYANLEVPFGADIETVRRSYKRLVLRYHPDRHAGDPERLRVATEITKKVNESFERIRSHEERSGAGRR